MVGAGEPTAGRERLGLAPAPTSPVDADPADHPRRRVSAGPSIPATGRDTHPVGRPAWRRREGMRSRPAPSHPLPRPQPESPIDRRPTTSWFRSSAVSSRRRPSARCSIDSVANALKSRDSSGRRDRPGSSLGFAASARFVVSQSGTITLRGRCRAARQPRRASRPRRAVESEPVRVETSRRRPASRSTSPSDDRQPDFLSYSDGESDAARGGRQPGEPPRPQSPPGRSDAVGGGSRAAAAAGGAADVWRGRPRQSAPGPQPADLPSSRRT